MTYQGLIGSWPAGPDFVASSPALWPALDRRLAKHTLEVQSEAERKNLVPSPAANERWTVRCPPLGVTWTWDGTRWLTWDDQPRTFPAYWYDGTDSTPLSVGTNGILTSTYQRRGYWCDMTMATVLGDSGGNVGAGGGEKWYWSLRYPPADMYQTGTARIRLANTAEWTGSVGLRSSDFVYVGMNGNRLNKDVVGWDSTAGNSVLIQMTYRLKL